MTTPGTAAADPLLEEHLDRLLHDVLALVGDDDPRLAEVTRSLVGHLHAFVRETRPSAAEWMAGMDFLVRTGRTCTPQRNEFILLSDMLGLTSAVDEVGFAGGPANATPSSVEGPFHSTAPARALGDWIAEGPERERAEPMVVVGRVTDCDGRPVSGAVLDIWQADDAGHYDSQDEAQPDGNLRALLTADAEGRYWFRSVVPSSYPVPTDGPAGELLRGIGRHPMRPAHLHLRVSAEGHRPVTTHVFVEGDPYLGSDAAFAVKPELVMPLEQVSDPDEAATLGVPVPFRRAVFDVRLARTEQVRA